jgi:hydroxyacyl-ACP dehydratase HTD2-like protein with hotdog domain
MIGAALALLLVVLIVIYAAIAIDAHEAHIEKTYSSDATLHPKD